MPRTWYTNWQDPRMHSLGNILKTYVKRNPTVGYCQGLNFVVAHLLRYFNEEEAFWGYCCLIESILPIDYYSEMMGVLIDQKIFNKLINALLPRLGAHFKKNNIDSSIFSLQWFICLFTNTLSPNVINVY